MTMQAYSYRLGRNVCMLDEAEWSTVVPSSQALIQSIKDYRSETGADIEEAQCKSAAAVDVLEAYRELTGSNLFHVNEIGVQCTETGHQYIEQCRKGRKKRCVQNEW